MSSQKPQTRYLPRSLVMLSITGFVVPSPNWTRTSTSLRLSPSNAPWVGAARGHAGDGAAPERFPPRPGETGNPAPPTGADQLFRAVEVAVLARGHDLPGRRLRVVPAPGHRPRDAAEHHRQH